MDTNYYPVFLQLNNKLCVVIGGGDVAARKVDTLLQSGATVRVVSPDALPAIEQLAAAGRIELLRQPFEESTLAGAFLVIAATSSPTANRLAASYCDAHGIICNVVDAPELCSFIVPATVNRGPLTIAVSTGGNAPAMARRIRSRLEEEFDHAYEAVLTTLGTARARILKQIPDSAVRRRLFTALAEEDLLQTYRQGGQAALEQKIEEIINSES